MSDFLIIVALNVVIVYLLREIARNAQDDAARARWFEQETDRVRRMHKVALCAARWEHDRIVKHADEQHASEVAALRAQIEALTKGPYRTNGAAAVKES